MPKTIDLYFARQMARTYLLVIGVIVAILLLENLTRLTPIVQNTSAPLVLLGRMMAPLVPEYLGIAIPIAVYLAVAFAIRSLSLRGEWQMIEALGVSPARYMMVPVLLAVVSGGCQLGIRFEVQPRGERALDHLSAEIRRGSYGALFPPGEIIRLDRHTTLVTDRDPSGAPGALTNIFVQQGQEVLTADRATLSLSGSGALSLTLRHGQLIQTDAGGQRSISFERYVMHLDGASPPPLSLARRLDRLTTAELRRVINDPHDRNAADANAALIARISSAAFCLVLPWLGLAFGVPPRRGTGGPAIFLGLVLIVLFFKLSDAIQQNLAQASTPAGLAHAASWAGFAWLLVGIVRRNPGASVDDWLARFPKSVTEVVYRWRRHWSRPPA